MSKLRIIYIGIFVFFIAVLSGALIHFNAEEAIFFANIRQLQTTPRDWLINNGSNGMSLYEIRMEDFDIQAHLYQYGTRVNSKQMDIDFESMGRGPALLLINWNEEKPLLHLEATAENTIGSIQFSVDFPEIYDDWFGLSIHQSNQRVRRGEEIMLLATTSDNRFFETELAHLGSMTAFNDEEPNLEGFSTLLVFTIKRR